MLTATTTATTSDDAHHRRIAPALERLRALSGRPGFGHSTKTSASTLVGDLRCETTEGASLIESDLPTALGGDDSAPTPSALIRAALGACLAMGYRLRAAELGIELTTVRVTVESESELRGMLDAAADVPPGLTALRYHVEIDSPAAQRDVVRVIELGDRLSPVLDMLTRPLDIERSVAIRPGA